jgi:SM-20-related protein
VDELAENIIDAIAERGVFVGPSIFGTLLTQSLALRAQTLAHDGALREARVGRATQATHHTSIRNDRTAWLDDAPSDPVEREAVDRVNALRDRLNAALFLGARSHELHFVHYAPGAFYKTHRDRFSDESARVLSLVFYLNEAWPDDAGGELVIYGDAMTTLHRVLPRAGTMVAFRSELFPHEVLPASRDRFSLTGWLRSQSALY